MPKFEPLNDAEEANIDLKVLTQTHSSSSLKSYPLFCYANLYSAEYHCSVHLRQYSLL